MKQIVTASRAFLFVALWALWLTLTATSASAQEFKEFTVPTKNAGPHDIVSGSDGNLWFTERNVGAIARFDLSTGAITEFKLPDPNSQPHVMTQGPNGHPWFTENGDGANRIGYITPDGAITEFTIPTPNTLPRSMTTLDDHVWFVENARPAIGRSTVDGRIREFLLPPEHLGRGIVGGPDGNVWVAVGAPPGVGTFSEILKIDPETGAVIEAYEAPTPLSEPAGIEVGPDGNIWFTELRAGQVGRLNITTGEITEFKMPANFNAPFIRPGPDGNMYYAEEPAAGNSLGQVTMNGEIRRFAIPTPASGTRAMRTGPDGSLWFCEFLTNKIGRFIPPDQ
jgi:virginiamycin B lyase